jgi:hypothetical protein
MSEIDNDDDGFLESEDEEVIDWLDEIEDSIKREEAFEKQAREILDIYNSEKGKISPYNILYANTDIMLPALFSNQPRPSVKRRFPDDDPLSQAVSKASNRMLEYLIDTNIQGYEPFYDACRNAVIDALLPGRGITQVKYDFEGDEGQKDDEYVCTESIEWDGVLFGYAKKWSKMPWIAFIHHMTKAQCEKLFDEDVVKNLNFTANSDDNEEKKENDKQAKHQGIKKTCLVYQIWDREEKKVRYLSDTYKQGFLDVIDDPLSLSGFYPIPRPISFVAKSNDFLPTPLYSYYREQARELNLITRRINKLINAIRVKFVYDTELKGDFISLASGSEYQPFNINSLLDDDDENIGIPAQKSGTLESSGGFDKHIWFMPIEQMIKVLIQLYQAREQIKTSIYEITGTADIMRGATDANETASAQQIKSQWGTLRLKDKQAEVARYVRDLMRIMLELAASNMDQEKWAKVTGLPYATDQQVMQAQATMQQFQMAQQQGSFGQMPQQQGEDGQPPPIPPEIQQAQQILQQPKWSDILQVLNDDMTRSYKIDIETNTTVMPEVSEDTQNMAQALAAVSQAIGELSPLIQQGVLPFQAAQTLLLSVIRRYQLGDDVEDAIKQMKEPPPPPQPVDNTLEVKKMDIQQKQMEMQAQAQKDQQDAKMLAQIEQGKAATEMHLQEQELLSKERMNEQALLHEERMKQAELENQRLIEQGKAATEMRMQEQAIQAEASIESMRKEFDEKLKHIEMLYSGINESGETDE